MTRNRINSLIGFGLLVLGSVGLFSLYAVRVEGEFLGLRRWINTAPVLWGVASTAVAGFGVQLSWKTAHPSTRWSPSEPGVRFESIVLYTRTGCHLCDEAHELLLRYRHWLPSIKEVDIDDHPELLIQFDTCVPVVECDGKVRFRGPLSESLLQRLIEGTEPIG